MIPVDPQVISGIQQISLSSLEDDAYFFGDWGGIEFDGKNYRTLHAGGGGIRLEILYPETRMLFLTVRGEKESTIAVSLNNRKIKELPIPTTRESTHKILLPKRLLIPGENRISLRNLQDSVLKIYHLSSLPSPLVNKYNVKGKIDEMALPARLTYYLWPRDETFEIIFDKPIQKISAVLVDQHDQFKSFNYKNRREIHLDLGPWQDKILKIDVLLEDPHKMVKIKASGYRHRKNDVDRNSRLEEIEKRMIAGTGQYNILVILLDSARPDRFSTYGYQRPTTPHIDRLAGHSMIFTRAYAEANYTLASTASLFSGLPPDYHNAVSNYYGGLHPNIETLAEVYRKNGYFTAAVSAIPYCGRAFHMEQGFDEFIELFKGEDQAMAEEFIPHLQTLLERAQQERKKFFIYLHIREPHIDFAMKPPFFGTFHQNYESYPNPEFRQRLKEIYFGTGRYRDRKYSATDIGLLSDSYDENLLSADNAVGNILSLLEEKGLDRRTVRIVTADHGEGLNEHGLIGHNVILYREGMQIPLIVNIPGITENKIIVCHPVTTTDLTATLRQLAGPPDGAEKINPAKGLFYRQQRKLLIGRTIFFSRLYPFYVLQEGGYRCIIPFPRSAREIQLYDIDTDPGEKMSLEQPLIKEYFYFRLQNFFRRKDTFHLVPRKADLKSHDLESLKSLGYL